jgi:hypothetical protein
MMYDDLVKIRQGQETLMSRNKIDLIVVVNGQPTTVEGNLNAPLRTIVERALQQTANAAGQPPENWELRDAAGALLPIDNKIEDFGFPEGTRLFLNLKAGVGGDS